MDIAKVEGASRPTVASSGRQIGDCFGDWFLSVFRRSRYPSHQETHRRTRFASSRVSWSGGAPKRLQLRASSLALSSSASVGIDAPMSKMQDRAILLNIGSLHLDINPGGGAPRTTSPWEPAPGEQ